MERQSLYEKFKTLNWRQQLGNLASTLATISSQATISQNDKLTCHLLREVALMIEWCASNVPSEFILELAAIQRECLEWKKNCPLENNRNLLALHTRNQSDRVLQMSGLLPELLPEEQNLFVNVNNQETLMLTQL